ncbi:hypothetical protein [Serratia marcescens]|uniref:hypothetical protein n=1 Tax=Serratia marcescens TaxID=615 RepID=UPI001CDBED43|nr:hypothetical protein [Serratia marcescens]MCA4112168.1 hypothetical protein [Serratia marcescens]MDX7571894.1 hypothetical protein [Serratia marcescens]BEN27596.1 hypothetical protein SMKC032_36910 [Serratia marcescens]
MSEEHQRRTDIEILDINPAYRGDKVLVKNRKTGEVVAEHDVISYADVNYWHSFSDEPIKKRMPCVRINGDVQPFEAPAGHDLVHYANPEQYLHLTKKP